MIFCRQVEGWEAAGSNALRRLKQRREAATSNAVRRLEATP
jgi:hypothetical protein